MTIDEVIEQAREKADKNSGCWKHCLSIIPCEKCEQEYEQIAEWLEELKELRKYKERMEMQYLDDTNNPLEPLKLANALKSEILKYEYRKEHKPQDINPLDYTVMYALKHCLKEQLMAGE